MPETTITAPAPVPEAIRLAAWLNEGCWHQIRLGDVEAAGRELRRLHAENAGLRAALAAAATQLPTPGEPSHWPVEMIASDVCQAVAELGDRNSPEGQPAMMLVTAEELHEIVMEALNAATQPLQEMPHV